MCGLKFYLSTSLTVSIVSIHSNKGINFGGDKQVMLNINTFLSQSFKLSKNLKFYCISNVIYF